MKHVLSEMSFENRRQNLTETACTTSAGSVISSMMGCDGQILHAEYANFQRKKIIHDAD